MNRLTNLRRELPTRLGWRLGWVLAIVLPLILAACNNGGSSGPGY